MPVFGGWLSALFRPPQLENQDSPAPSPQAPVAPGMFRGVLGQRYHLQHLVGRGASSIVYQAHDAVLDQTVAVKVLVPSGLMAGSGAQSIGLSLQGETRTAMLLSHPHILRVHNYDRDGDIEYLVMEYVVGETLQQLARRRDVQRLEPGELVRYANQVLLALDYAHARGVVHNDIKPENLMLCRPGGIKVCDFGLAQTSQLPRGRLTAGTPAFMSPERIRGLPGDARSDLYSLGATLFALGIGHPPFGKQMEAAAQGHLFEVLPPNTDLPPALYDLIATSMEKRPDQRFQSAESMRRALLAFDPSASTPEPTDLNVDQDTVPTTTMEVRAAQAAEAAPGALPEPVKKPKSAHKRRSTDTPPDVASRSFSTEPPTGASDVGSRSFSTDPYAAAPKPQLPDRNTQDRSTQDRRAPPPSMVNTVIEPRATDLPMAPEAPSDIAAVGTGLERFFLERLPVTNARFAEFVAATGEIAPAHWARHTPPPAILDHPVVGVSFDQALRYAKWKGRRLPTTSEWMRAATGGGSRTFPWGNAWEPERCLGAHNCAGRLHDTESAGARVAGSTPEGIRDLVGNVWEWTEADPGVTRPEDGTTWVCGGSFRNPLDKGAGRSQVGLDKSYLYLGFRCAVDGTRYR